MPSDFIPSFLVERSPSGTVGDPGGDPIGTLNSPITQLGTIPTTSTTGFTFPAKGSQVTITVADNTWMRPAENQELLIEYGSPSVQGVARFQVISVSGTTSATLLYLNIPDNPTSNSAPNAARVMAASFPDTTVPNPDLYYRLSAVSQNGQAVPWNVVKVSSAVPGTVNWVIHLVGSGYPPQPTSVVWSVGSDSFGNVFTGGTLAGTVDLGGQSVSAAGNGAFIAKYTPSGVLLFKRAISAFGINLLCLAVAADGSVLIAGSFAASTDFGGGSVSPTNPNGDLFVASYSSDLSTLNWVKHYGTSGSALSTVYGIAADLSGIYICGVFGNTLNLGTGNLVSAGGLDVFFAKLAVLDGATQWAKPIGGSGYDTTHGLALSNDSVFVVGETQSPSVNFGNGAVPTLASQTGWLARYSKTDGSLVAGWPRIIGYNVPNNPGTLMSITGVSVDSNNDPVICGSILETADFGDGPIRQTTVSAAFIARYTKSNVFSIKKIIGGSGYSDQAHRVVSQGTNIFLVASFKEGTDLGGGNFIGANSNPSFCLVKYDSAGSFLWSNGNVLTSYAIQPHSAVLSGANITVVGSFGGTTDLGKGSISSPAALVNDGFIVQYVA